MLSELLWVLFIVMVTILAVFTGRKICTVSNSLIPWKEPVTPIIYGWLIGTFLATLLRPEWFEWFFAVPFYVMLAFVISFFISYPIGYSFGKVKTQGIVEYDFETMMITDAYYIVYFENRKGEMCIMEQTILAKIKAFFGIYCYLIFPFNKVVNTQNIRARGKFLKTTTKGCVSVIDKDIQTIRVKWGPFQVKTRIYSYYLSDIHDLDPREFSIRATLYKSAMKAVAKLQNELLVEKSKKVEVYQIAADLVADIQNPGIDTEIIEEAKKRLDDDIERIINETKRRYGDVDSQEGGDAGTTA